jgi:hypothetical protein
MDAQDKHPRGGECDCGNHGEACGCGDGCCGDGESFERRYRTKAERVSDLEAYLAELKLEVRAVEEHLADLRK